MRAMATSDKPVSPPPEPTPEPEPTPDTGPQTNDAADAELARRQPQPAHKASK